MNERQWLDSFNAFYYQKKIKLMRSIYPIYVGFKITENCNQKCIHCWAGKNRKSDYPLKKIILALEKIAELSPYHVTITGGEPLLHKSWREIVYYANELFPVIELFTNGVLFSERDISCLSSVFKGSNFIQISLDGLRESYKKQRGKDNFEVVVRNIKLLIDSNINVRLNMTVTPFNIDDVYEIYLLAKKLKVKTFSISPVYPLRKGKKLVPLVDYEQYQEIGETIEKDHNIYKEKMNLMIIYPIEVSSRQAKYTPNIMELKKFNTDILHWAIDGEGNIFHFMDQSEVKKLKVGNIYEDDIEVLVENDFKIQKMILFYDVKNLKCRSCDMVNICSGGTYANSFPCIAYDYERCMMNEE